MPKIRSMNPELNKMPLNYRIRLQAGWGLFGITQTFFLVMHFANAKLKKSATQKGCFLNRKRR